MALMEKLPGVTAKPTIPVEVTERCQRGRKSMLKDASKRRLCMRFERGDTYWYLNERGFLNFQSSAQVGNPAAPKPQHRIRNTYNFIRPIVQGKVSQATQRIPSYEILPSTTDPEDVGAARLAEKIALYGYDKWGIRRATVKTVSLAIGGGGEGFAMPYFDSNVGPFTTVPTVDGLGTKKVGQGEIKIMVLNGNEVYWEPGVDFQESRWWAIERARPLDEVHELPGFWGPKLVGDANTSDVPTDRDRSDQMVMVTEYFERPCPKYPEGRRLVMAGKRLIVDYRLINPNAQSPYEPYPLRDRDGQVIDEPIIHRLQWNVDTDTDRDLGLTWQLIDAQRTIQDCWNKLLEWKNRCLNPRMRAPRGSNMKPRVDEPGGIDWFDVVGNGNVVPEWESVPSGFAQPLFEMLNKMQADMREMGFDADISANANVAARTVTAVVEQSNAKWQSFMGETAEWHSRLMRHCLLLVSTYYTEPRKLSIRGRNAPESITDFEGAKLMGQVDVRVLPSSLEYLTRDAMNQQVFAFADRGWISGQQAMLAISSGAPDNLVQSLELDIARIDRIIQKIRDNTIMEMPTRQETQVDPVSGQQQIIQVPSWMPVDQVDNLKVWHVRLTDWMKTQDYETLPPQQQEQAKLILAGIDQLTVQQQQREVAQQNAAAEQLGMQNAAKPQGAKPMPDQAKPGAPDKAPEKSPTGLAPLKTSPNSPT